jgi:hypothetical protein
LERRGGRTGCWLTFLVDNGSEAMGQKRADVTVASLSQAAALVLDRENLTQ